MHTHPTPATQVMSRKKVWLIDSFAGIPPLRDETVAVLLPQKSRQDQGQKEKDFSSNTNGEEGAEWRAEWKAVRKVDS